LAEAAYDYLIAEVQLGTITGAFKADHLREVDSRYLDAVVEIGGEDDAS
jgi:hypothetical protein